MALIFHDVTYYGIKSSPAGIFKCEKLVPKSQSMEEAIAKIVEKMFGNKLPNQNLLFQIQECSLKSIENVVKKSMHA